MLRLRKKGFVPRHSPFIWTVPDSFLPGTVFFCVCVHCISSHFSENGSWKQARRRQVFPLARAEKNTIRLNMQSADALSACLKRRRDRDQAGCPAFQKGVLFRKDFWQIVCLLKLIESLSPDVSLFLASMTAKGHGTASGNNRACRSPFLAYKGKTLFPSCRQGCLVPELQDFRARSLQCG